MMKRILLWCLAMIPLLIASPLRADQLSFQNNFTSDDVVIILGFSLTAPGTVTLRTFGYAGGINGAGSTVVGGGFDPLLTLFDGAGNFLVSNNDGACGELEWILETDALTHTHNDRFTDYHTTEHEGL